VWALLKRLLPVDANLDAKIDTAIGGIAFKLEDPHERANRGVSPTARSRRCHEHLLAVDRSGSAQQNRPSV
jgi:hypothetical protein